MKKKSLALSDKVFIVCFFMIIFCFGFLALFNRKTINSYENRPAVKFALPTMGKYFVGDYQKQVEEALSDQILYSTSMKKIYNSSVSRIKNILNKPFYSVGDQYYPFNGTWKFNDHIVYGIRDLESSVDNINSRISNINTAIEKYNIVDFFVYYIEKDTDIDFETNIKNGIYEYLKENITIKDNHISGLFINNFQDFESNFYKTDHHWNYKGSYRAYTELVKMIFRDTESPLPSGEPVIISKTFSGSKASMVGVTDVSMEPFIAYAYDLPSHKTYINGEEENYGNEPINYPSEPNTLSYGDYYGFDEALIHFDFDQPQKENILIIGESYDNAILKLLASHFNNTYSVDLRNYEEMFDLGHFLREHEIDKVLFVGNIDFFVSQKFNLK